MCRDPQPQDVDGRNPVDVSSLGLDPLLLIIQMDLVKVLLGYKADRTAGVTGPGVVLVDKRAAS